MKSELEKFINQKVYQIRNILAFRDRAVVLGAILSFIPIPPACILGVIISLVNFLLLKINKLRKSEQKLILISLLVGLFNSIIGTYIMILLGNELFLFLNNILDTVHELFNFQIFKTDDQLLV
jgi:hypothetical protein